MKPIEDKQMRLRLMGLVPKLSIAKGTMQNYLNNGQFSTDTCIEIERLTNGEISRQNLRPDKFQPLPCHYELVTHCVRNFVEHLNSGKHQLIVAILNFLEYSQPIAYKKALEEISKLEGGEYFVALRIAHRGEYDV